MSNKQNDNFYETVEEMKPKHITLTLTEDQVTELETILTNAIPAIWERAQAIDMVPAPEYLAFIRRIQAKLAQAKS